MNSHTSSRGLDPIEGLQIQHAVPLSAHSPAAGIVLPARILIVEDQGIVAHDIERCLTDNGFEVTAIAASMEEAVREASRSRPDLALMDIRLRGDVDGIETATRLHRDFDLPIIFLTAHSDPETVARATQSEPMAFLLKPFNPAELTIAVEVALKRTRAEREIQARERSFLSAMNAIGEAVLTTDAQSRVRFMNRAAEELTGWQQEQALGCEAAEVVHLANEASRGGRSFGALLYLVDALGSEDAIIAQDSGGTITSWNRTAELLYGYRAEDVLGKPASMLMWPYRLESLREIAERVKRGEPIPPVEGLEMAKGDKRIDVSISVCPVLTPSGQITGRTAVIRDITDRRRAEESAAFLASIVASSEDAIIGKTLEGVIISWNHGAERLYGYTATEAIGMHVGMLDLAENARIMRRMLNAILQGERTAPVETIGVRKDASRFDVSLTLSPIRNNSGQVIGVARIARDISEHKRAQDAIRRSEEKYRSLVDNIPDVVWTADASGIPVFIGSAIEKVYGYSADEICDTDVWFKRIHPEDAAKVQAAYEAMLTRGEALDAEYRVQHKDGRWIWLHAKAVSQYEKDGECFVDGITSDVTAIRQAREELIRAKEAAEAAAKAKSTFLTNMNHELRTPMNGVIGMTELVLESDLTAEQRECLQAAKSSADHLLYMIDDVLDFAKIEARKLKLNRVPFDLRSCITTAIKALSFRASVKHIGVTCEIAPDTPATVRGTPALCCRS